MKKALAYIRKADQDFSLITSKDSIAVGVSGGKDSTLLLVALAKYRLFSKKDFTLTAIALHPGPEAFDASALKALCESLEIPFMLEDTRILDYVMPNTTPGKAPCSLCARIRRGALNNAAIKAHCNKVALGHHADDALETFLMSMFFEGRLNTIPPKSYLTRTNLTVIRPLLYMPEREIIHTVQKLNLPVHTPICPFDGHTNREEMKILLQQLSTQIPHAKKMMLSALQNTQSYNLWDKY